MRKPSRFWIYKYKCDTLLKTRVRKWFRQQIWFLKRSIEISFCVKVKPGILFEFYASTIHVFGNNMSGRKNFHYVIFKSLTGNSSFSKKLRSVMVQPFHRIYIITIYNNQIYHHAFSKNLSSVSTFFFGPQIFKNHSLFAFQQNFHTANRFKYFFNLMFLLQKNVSKRTQKFF